MSSNDVNRQPDYTCSSARQSKIILDDKPQRY